MIPSLVPKTPEFFESVQPTRRGGGAEINRGGVYLLARSIKLMNSSPSTGCNAFGLVKSLVQGSLNPKP